MPTLLVIDDEPSVLIALRRAFRDGPVGVLTAESADEGLGLAVQHRPDAVLLDTQLPDRPCLDALARLHALDARCPVLLITGRNELDTVVEAAKLGVHDTLPRPLEMTHLRQAIDEALAISRVRRVPVRLAGDEPVEDGADALVGKCPAVLDAFQAILLAASRDGGVLITGESGTGRELAGRAVYQRSQRAAAPFFVVDCAALAERLLESDLFGHEKGAFSGADRRRIGKIEAARGGVLYLDEVADLAPVTQMKLLRLLRERAFERVGGSLTLTADVRILAATTQNLAALAAQGKFRKDLYERLGDVTIHLPPLRERGDDLPHLVAFSLRRFTAAGRKPPAATPEVLKQLQRYHWPGNVDELQGALKQAVLQTSGSTLGPEALPAYLRRESKEVSLTRRVKSLPPAEPGLLTLEAYIMTRLRTGSANLYEEGMKHAERWLLAHELQRAGGEMVPAALALGLTLERLRERLRELELTKPEPKP